MTQMQPSDSPPVIPGDLPAVQEAWPKVFGIISIVLGSLGLATNACSAVSGLVGGPLLASFMKQLPSNAPGSGANTAADLERMMDAMHPWMVVSGVLALGSLFVSAWLLAAGIWLVKRRAAGVRQHINWAWVRIAMVLLTVGVTAASQVATFDAVRGIQGAQAGAPPAWVNVAMSALQGLFLLAFGLAYPIVVLVYMRKEKVRAAVASWEAQRAVGA